MSTLTVTQAKPHLGALLDKVSTGEELLIRRKERLYRVEEVTPLAPVPVRPVGYFNFDEDDELNTLANQAEPSIDDAGP